MQPCGSLWKETSYNDVQSITHVDNDHDDKDNDDVIRNINRLPALSNFKQVLNFSHLKIYWYKKHKHAWPLMHWVHTGYLLEVLRKELQVLKKNRTGGFSSHIWGVEKFAFKADGGILITVLSWKMTYKYACSRLVVTQIIFCWLIWYTELRWKLSVSQPNINHLFCRSKWVENKNKIIISLLRVSFTVSSWSVEECNNNKIEK